MPSRTMVAARLMRVVMLAPAVAVSAASGSQAGEGAAPADVRVTIEASDAETRARADAAASEAARLLSEWLGPPPAPITIRDARLPWWPAPASMDVEAAIALDVAGQWWPGTNDASTAALFDAIARHLGSRIVESLFDARYLRTAARHESVRLFGGVVPLTFPGFSVSRWARASDPSPGARGRAAIGSLERLLGWPTLQGALAAAHAAAVQGAGRAGIEQAIADAAGLDLAWFFAVAFDPARTVDYAVVSVTTRREGESCAGERCIRTEVVLVNRGSRAFPGTSRAPAGDFEAGDALELEVVFADGQRASTRWDGRAPSTTIAFESVSPASAVTLDPAGVVGIDRSRLDNRWRAAAGGGVPLVRWMAAWLVWLENAMLSCAAFA